MFLTVSHLAINRSLLNLAYSARSWMTVSSFQSSSNKIPKMTIPAITPNTIARIGTGGGQSLEKLHHFSGYYKRILPLCFRTQTVALSVASS